MKKSELESLRHARLHVPAEAPAALGDNRSRFQNAENGRWRSPKTDDGDHRKRTMAITENGDGDRWSDQSLSGSA
jgi:hypothetical protein